MTNIEKMFAFSISKGVRVFIHNQTNTPSYFEGFDAAVDHMVDVKVQRIYTERLPDPYSNCVEDISNFGSIFTETFSEKNLTYRQSYCFEFCYQRRVTDLCKCKILIYFILKI